jgi:DNA repair exonuclease SbcCD ATPase subunit
MNSHRPAQSLLALLLVAASAHPLNADEPVEKRAPEAEVREKTERAEAEAKERATAEKRAAAEKRRETAERGDRKEKPTPAQLKERLTDLMAQAREAEANGNRERIAELKPQINEIQQLLKRISSAAPELPPELRPEAEKLEMFARRIKHVFTAAENLAAADMQDLAHDLRRKAEAMERELAAAKEELMARAQPRKSPQPAEPAREIQALREENEQLQRKLRELSEQLERSGK